jgi:hypothetical protein
MALSKTASKALLSMGEGVGLSWYSNTLKTRATDGMLQICIGDGLIPTKIDGWIHACTLTAKAMAKYAVEPDAGLDLGSGISALDHSSRPGYSCWHEGQSSPQPCMTTSSKLHLRKLDASDNVEVNESASRVFSEGAG